MRNLVYFKHISLDGFVSRLNGELDWIKLDDSDLTYDFITTKTLKFSTALYGRVIYEMMQSYWLTAGEQPNASKNTNQLSTWYKKVSKIVLSKTINENGLDNTIVISNRLADKLNEIKQDGSDILTFVGPEASHLLLKEGLIDEFLLFIHPVMLGQGIPLFKNVTDTKLKLLETKTFPSGVIAVHYESINYATG